MYQEYGKPQNFNATWQIVRKECVLWNAIGILREGKLGKWQQNSRSEPPFSVGEMKYSY